MLAILTAEIAVTIEHTAVIVLAIIFAIHIILYI
jgi:hypothetical protein